MQIDFSNQNSSIEHLYSYTFVSEKKYKVHALRVFLVKTNNFFVHNVNKKKSPDKWRKNLYLLHINNTSTFHPFKVRKYKMY